MKTFEISSRKNKNGYKKFKLILLEIHNDNCIVDGVGTEYNDNGITWLEDYCQKQIETIKDSSVTVEFDGSDKVNILGHGATGKFKDGIPLLDNAETIGHFTKGYITDIIDDFGIKKRVVVGEGLLDYMRYPDCIDKLIEKLHDGETVYGSVEILKTGDNQAIIYKNGYVEYGRIPTEFEFSGYAILGYFVPPADHSATLLEVASLNKEKNETEELTVMDDKSLAMITDSIKATIVELNDKSTESATAIADLNSKIEEKDKTIEELNAKIAELEDCKKESEKCSAEQNEKIASLTAEVDAVKTEKAISELNEAIKDFTDEQKEYAKVEIDSYNESPLTSEINSVTAKIYEGIGKKSLEKSVEEAKILAEQNSKKEDAIDIFGDVDDVNKTEDDGSIF